ncbi:MAG TPA: hypothetical protein PLL77_11485 [Pyrinomonadaceae bacterium]|nr:hypothetical protein [Pyrinomonadaceae bacterium]
MENEQTTVRCWKEFDVSPPAARLEDYASINGEGKIVLNQRLYRSLGSPKAVSVLYDEARQTIGIRPVSPIMPNAFPVYHYIAGRRVWVRAAHFIKAAKLEFSYCIRFTAPHIEDNTLILNLHHTTRALGPKRNVSV